MAITRKSKRTALELRRSEVLTLTSRGYSQRSIAERMGVSVGLINNDLKILKQRARENIKYSTAILTHEMELSLVRLNDIIRHSFQDIESTDTNTKEKHEAMLIVKDCSALRLEILGSGVLANQLNQQQSQSHNETSTIPN